MAKAKSKRVSPVYELELDELEFLTLHALLGQHIIGPNSGPRGTLSNIWNAMDECLEGEGRGNMDEGFSGDVLVVEDDAEDTLYFTDYNSTFLRKLKDKADY